MGEQEGPGCRRTRVQEKGAGCRRIRVGEEGAGLKKRVDKEQPRAATSSHEQPRAAKSRHGKQKPCVMCVGRCTSCEHPTSSHGRMIGGRSLGTRPSV